MTDPFPRATCAYLADLAANNSRDWFEANRTRYETAWLAPAKDLVFRLSDAMAALDPPHKATPKINGSIRRLNRDVRFSKDKSPYDPRLHLIFWTGAHPNRSPGLHLVLRADGLGLGVGHWGMSAVELDRFRTAILDPLAGAELGDLLSATEAAGFSLMDPALKRVPAGFDADHPRAELLKHKGLVVWTGEAARPADLIGDDAALMHSLAPLVPINGWLQSYVTGDGG